MSHQGVQQLYCSSIYKNTSDSQGWIFSVLLQTSLLYFHENLQARDFSDKTQAAVLWYKNSIHNQSVSNALYVFKTILEIILIKMLCNYAVQLLFL